MFQYIADLLCEFGQTRELLSYVRGLLGPKAAAATAARRISTGVSPLSFNKPATSNA